MILLTSVFCVVLSLQFGAAIPKGNRFKESHLRNEGNNEFNVERNTGGPPNTYNIPNNENELIYQENQKNMNMNNENYEKVYTNNNPAAFRNVHKEQQSAISESREYNQNTAEKNFNHFNEEPPRSSYIGSLPQVNRMQNFRQRGEVNHEANMPRMVDILSEVNDPYNDPAPILQEKNPANQRMNKYNRQNVQVPENFNEKEDEETTLSDVPVATPEYIKSLYNEDKHTRKNNVKPTITNSPRHYIRNKNLQSNSQNVNEATFQNPSAEILYETGQAKPYEISNEPPINSRQGNTNAQNILKDKQRLKNLYLSSKPTKHYMIVYPDGRVEQVDQLDKIQKVHPNYVMLNANELLQHGQPNTKNTGSQSVVKQNLQTTTTTTIRTQSNSEKYSKDDQIDKVPQTVNKQNEPAPNELPVATESPTISTTENIKTNNAVTSTDDKLKESEINDSQEKNKLNNNENTNSGAIVTTSDYSNNEFSTLCTTETPDTEDIVTTVRSTISTPTADTEVINQNNSNPLSPSNNTDNPNVSKDPEDSNTSGGNLTNTKDGSVLADENTTPTPKQESTEDESVKNTTTVTSDLNTVKENSYTTDRIETSNVNNETINTDTNSSSLDSSVNKKESNSTTKSNNETVITSEDGVDKDGNTFHIEKIVTNNTNENSAQNVESNNVTSSDSNTLVTKSNTTEIDNSPTENTQNNTNPLPSSNSLTKKDENNTDTTTNKTLSNVTNSEVDGTKNDNNNLKPVGDTPNNKSDSIYTNASSSQTPDKSSDVNSAQEESNLNKTSSTNIKQEGSTLTDDSSDDSEAPPTGKKNVDNDDDKTDKDVPNGGAVSANEEDTAPGAASDDLYYLNSPQKDVPEDYEVDDTNNEIGPETINANDNLDQESPTSDGTVKESSFWFNANESFWKKLLSSNDHNSFYFLFPRPKPNTKETKKIIYPNGTVVVETTETIDNDGETNSTKTVLSCGNCTTSEKTL